MFGNWFKGKEAPAPAPAARPRSIFSSDLPGLSPEDRETFRTRAFQSSIQSGPPKRSDASGSAIAADSADNGAGEIMREVFNNFASTLPDLQLSFYASQGFIGFQAMGIIAQNWLVDKACSMPARDAVRSGYDITIESDEEPNPVLMAQIKQGLKDFNINDNLVQATKFNRVFGIRVVMFLVRSTDPKYYEKPFNPDGITPNSYLGISQVDPYWLAPILDDLAASNPMDPYFYVPTWWVCGARRIHRSHLIVLRGSEVIDVLKPSYLYAGLSVPGKIAERVYGAERTSNEAPLLAMSKRMTVYKTDLTLAMADPEKFGQKMASWVALMNNFGVKVIGTEDTIEQHDSSLADLDAIIMTQYQIVSGASEVPVTKLLGTVPKGFNSTGEYDESSYHEMLESLQEHEMTPIIERHLLLWSRSVLGVKDMKFNIVWKPLDALTAKEQAEINAAKATTDKTWSDAGAIDGQDIRDRLIKDPNSGYTGIASSAPEPEIIEPDDQQKPDGTEEETDTPADKGEGG